MSTSRAWNLAATLILGVLLQGPAEPAWSASQVLDGTWSALSGSAPSARREYAVIYDETNQRQLLFSGLYRDLNNAYVEFNEVWILALGPTPTWSYLSIPGPAPGERHGAQWGYDPARNRLLVFGGYGSHYPGNPYAYLNDVWQLSLDGTPAWTELFPSGTAPTGRLGGAAVYDLFRQRFVGFGGTVGVPVDTWQLDLSGDPAWSSVATSSASPNGGYGMTSIYEPAQDRMLIFGGSANDGYFGSHNDVWELRLRPDTPVWHQLTPAGPLPRVRRSGASIHDPLRDRMIVFGGWDAQSDNLSSFLNDTWALSLQGQPQWTQLSPGGSLPAGRDAIAATYDPAGDRLVVYGGWSGVAMLDDTWFLSWGGQGQAASVTPTSEADPGAARVQWSVQNATSSYGAVYRSADNGPWTSIATVESDASGVVAYEDKAVQSGRHYGYLLAVPSQRGCDFTGQVSVDVPSVTAVPASSTADFALDRVRPNPVVDRFTVSFTLPSDAPARLELLDVGGRRILSRAVGSLGAGPHTLEMSSPRDVRPGVYLLRLSQAGRSLTNRLVIGGAR
jgi:hypothetical protein